MKVKCRHCGSRWGVSVLQEIPKQGYECPICATKKELQGIAVPTEPKTKLS